MNIKNIIKILLPIFLGAIIGYSLYYFILMDIIILFVSHGFTYFFVSIICLLLSILGSIMMLNLIINKTINKILFFTIYCSYFLFLLAVLFLRKHTEQIFILNPFISIMDLFSSWQMLFQSLFNFLVFIPLGYIFKNLNFKKMILFSFIISLLIELLQYITNTGFFDTFDIILYLLGMSTGYFIFKKIKLKFNNK